MLFASFLRLIRIEGRIKMTTFNGTISFTIKAAKKLTDTDTTLFNISGKDLTDPLVVIEINGVEVFRTDYINNCLDPVWKSDNTHDHEANESIREILIDVKDKETIGTECVGGKSFVGDELKAFAKDKKIDGWFRLRSKSGKGEYLAQSEVHFEMKYNTKIVGNATV